jgi:hypothetical protein
MSEATPLDLREPGRQAHVDPHSIPLDEIDVSDVELWATDTFWGNFERLRKEDPVQNVLRHSWEITREHVVAI